MSVVEGSQGTPIFEYAELKYQRSKAPAEIPLKKLAQLGGSLWCIEKTFQSGKGECGLDGYETRGWTGWHHQTCLSMLALLFLMLQKQRLKEKHPQLSVPEIRTVLKHLLQTRDWTFEELALWSQWRTTRNQLAKQCHEQRRRKELRRRIRKRKQAL